MAKTQEQNWNNILEGGEKLVAPKDVDVSILQQAPEYNVDLTTLEVSPDEETKTPKTKQNKSVDLGPLADMDVKLADMINLVFNKVDYPIFIIQDDALMYANAAAWQQLDLNQNNTLGRPFLELIDKQDWNLLAENIGEMLTSHNRQSIRFALPQGSITMNLQAVYLQDIEHFSFILLGETKSKATRPSSGVLYDEKTGLPSFFLFEDRLQMALIAEHAKENANERCMVAIVGINIDNVSDFSRINLAQVMLKKIADNLIFNLPKTVTVAVGLKYHFWLLLGGLKNEFELDFYLRRIKEILDAGIKDNFMHHDLLYSGGVSIAPNDAQTAKKMIEHTIFAVRSAQDEKNNSILIYAEKK